MGCKGSLLAMEVGTSNIDAAAIASKPQAGARSHNDFGCSQILYTPHQTCGSGLARDGSGSGNINVGCADLIASRLAPTVNLVAHKFCIHPHQTCGSGLARDGSGSGNIDFGRAHSQKTEGHRCGLSRGRGADQVVEGAQRSLGALAYCNHDLLVRHGGHVTGGKHPGNRGFTAVIDDDLASW